MDGTCSAVRGINDITAKLCVWITRGVRPGNGGVQGNNQGGQARAQKPVEPTYHIDPLFPQSACYSWNSPPSGAETNPWSPLSQVWM